MHMRLECYLLTCTWAFMHMVCSAQRDTSSTTHMALVSCMDLTDARDLEKLVVEAGLPAPLDQPYRGGLMLYGSGGPGVVMEMHYTTASGSTRSDSSRARTSYTSLGLSAGYAMIKSQKFELATTIGWNYSVYGYAIDDENGQAAGPDVSFDRNSISATVISRYGQRVSLLFGVTCLFPLDPGTWIDDRTGGEITEAPPVNFRGSLLLGISYRIQTLRPMPLRPSSDDGGTE